MGNLVKKVTKLHPFSMATNIFDKVSGGAVGNALDSIGGDVPGGVSGYRPFSFASPGLSGTVGENVIDLSRGQGVNAALAGVNNLANSTNTELGRLKSQLGPGFAALTDAALANLESRRRATIGNLQENLARRRLAGSSFAGDALARAESEFAQQAGEIRSRNMLAGIDAANQLIQQQHNVAMQSFQTSLGQLNFESGIAAQVASGVSGLMAANAQMQSQLNAQAQAGMGQLLGNLAGIGLQGLMA